MKEFISYLAKVREEGVETIAFTNGQRSYADKLIEIIDPKREVF